MSNFKVCLKILRKNLLMLMITLILPFIILHMQLSFFEDSSKDFVNAKPSIYIINNDKENDLLDSEKNILIKKNKKENEEEKIKKIKDKDVNITKNFLTYMYTKTIVQEFNKKGDDLKNILDDSLYLNKISAIITIPENFRKDILSGKDPKIKIVKNSYKSADLTNRIVDKYMRNVSLYNKENIKEEDLIKIVSEIASAEVETKMEKKQKPVEILKSEFVFSFISYSIISSVLTVDLIVLYYFNLKSIKKRIEVSSEKKENHKTKLFFAILAVTAIIVFIYILSTYLFININVIKSYKGLLYGVNAFIFGISIMSMAFLISKFIKTIGGATGITVVISLAMSFLSGAFVPREILPDVTIKISKIIPSFYYVDNVLKISNASSFNEKILSGIFKNFVIMGIFVLIFAIFTVIFKNVDVEKQDKNNRI